jgi:glutathione-regulated potassium-efflux system ancillary protein KefC
VFQTATAANVFSSQTSSLLIGSVAVSMLVSPMLLLAIDKLLLPRFASRGGPQLEELAEQQDAPIIIAGFGRYGQIVGRTLQAQGLRATVLDHDADMVEAIRQFGFRVFYGDATRLDLLRLSGAATAKILVVAVDDKAQSLKIVDMAREHFPNLEIVARARDVPHWNALRDRGVLRVERELFESSLRSARAVLEILGYPPHEARQQAMRFRQHNLALFEQMYPHRKDRAKFIAVATEGRQQLEEQMAQERAQQAQRRPKGWGK